MKWLVVLLAKKAQLFVSSKIFLLRILIFLKIAPLAHPSARSRFLEPHLTFCIAKLSSMRKSLVEKKEVYPSLTATRFKGISLLLCAIIVRLFHFTHHLLSFLFCLQLCYCGNFLTWVAILFQLLLLAGLQLAKKNLWIAAHFQILPSSDVTNSPFSSISWILVARRSYVAIFAGVESVTGRFFDSHLMLEILFSASYFLAFATPLQKLSWKLFLDWPTFSSDTPHFISHIFVCVSVHFIVSPFKFIGFSP